jgi:Trk-type K+ transport system membrane component
MPIKHISHFSPGRVVLASMACAIAAGTFLLSLPIARKVPIPLIDLFFTSTSVTCVTGLLTVPLTDFTSFGQVIILCLMQIGGLGLITLTLFLMLFFIEFGLGAQILAGKLLELETRQNIRHMIFFIIGLTIAIELIGAFFIFLAISHEYQWHKAVFLSIFHSVASFCDAGLSLFPDGMIAYKTNSLMLVITSILMLLGGIGFLTIHELLEYARMRRAGARPHLSLQTKITLSVTALVMTGAILLFWLLERQNTLANMEPITAVLNSIFNAIANRSTGFLTVSIFDLNIATILMIMIVAFIGSSPGSTGSGIRTTTFAIFLATVKAAIEGKSSVQIKSRRIAKDQVYRTLAIIALSQAWILVTVFCLLITEKGWDFLDVVFAVVSAYATLGVDTGITPYLSFTGKILIMATMVVGRIGSLTVALALRKKLEAPEFQYPEERVMLS